MALAFVHPGAQSSPFSMVALGDSLAYGVGASTPSAGFISGLHAALRQRYPHSTLMNFAVPHSTIGDVVRRQLSLIPATADVVVVIAGANDLRYTRDVLGITRSFSALLDAIRKAAPKAQIVAGGMPDVTQTVAVPYLLKGPVQRLCARINVRMREIVFARGFGFIDMFAYTNAPLHQGVQYLCADGFHPNDFGYNEIAQRAYPAFLEAVERAERGILSA